MNIILLDRDSKPEYGRAVNIAVRQKKLVELPWALRSDRAAEVCTVIASSVPRYRKLESYSCSDPAFP